MKKLTLTIILLLFSRLLFGQILHPVHWSYAAKKTGKNTAVVFLKATLDEGWHLYSVNEKDGDGPIKTNFKFTASKFYRLIDGVSEPTPITKYESVFKMDVKYFEKSVIFQQKIIVNSANLVIQGTVNFMTCNDQRCLPPDEISFKIPVK